MKSEPDYMPLIL